MSDFLDEIWGIDKLYINSHELCDLDIQSAGILFCVSNQNYDRFIKMQSFKKIFANYDINEYTVQLFQIQIINSIQKLKIKRALILEIIEEIFNANIITFNHFNYLKNFLLNLQIEENNVVLQNSNVFHKNLQNLNEIADLLSKFNYEEQNKELHEAMKNANNSKFFISITGVINAGKSSTLNALMGKKILGVSNIPETASLSVINYDEKEFARVEFHDKKMQEKLNLPIKELEDKNINIDEIIHYTAAFSELSRYVKQVILNTNLDILKDGICIVDTPGLDDAVVWREELTQDYMQKSDFIIHLMNAAQSVTKKDINFICQTLKNTKSAGVIIVLTHADLLSKNDLHEALEYAKKSVKNELIEYGFDENLAKKVEYFGVSAVSKVGISELKNYLYESFFGQNSQKASLIIDNYKKKLQFVCEFIKKDFDLKLRTLSSDNMDINTQMSELDEKLNSINIFIQEMQNDLQNITSKLKYDTNDLSSFLNITSRIRDRVLSDIKYSNSKKQKIDFDRIDIIVTSGFKDLFIDLFRDFKQKIANDLNSFHESLSLKFKIKDFNFELPNIKNYFDNTSLNIDFTMFKELHEAINKNKSHEALSQKISDIFSEFMSKLELSKQLENLTNECLKDFLEVVNIKIHELKSSFLSQENAIKQSLELISQNKENQENEIKEIKNQLKTLQEIESRILSC